MRKNLKLLRVEHDLTQEEMAARLGVTRTTYCNVENGKSDGSSFFWLNVQREFPGNDLNKLAKVVRGVRD